jgi:hypothetical protein
MIVAERHWFDELNKRLARSAPRRGFLSAVTALSIAQQLGASDVAAKGGGKGGKHKGGGKGGGKAGGGNHGNKGKGKGKQDEKNDPWGCYGRYENLPIKDPNCSGGVCKSTWPSEPCEQKWCEFICNQCDEEDVRDFCFFVDSLDPSHKAAECCPPDQSCVGGQCVYKNCPDGLTRCDGECVDTKTDPRHCGRCNAQNPHNICCDGNPCTYVDGVCCGGTCYPSYWPSCD